MTKNRRAAWCHSRYSGESFATNTAETHVDYMHWLQNIQHMQASSTCTNNVLLPVASVSPAWPDTSTLTQSFVRPQPLQYGVLRPLPGRLSARCTGTRMTCLGPYSCPAQHPVQPVPGTPLGEPASAALVPEASAGCAGTCGMPKALPTLPALCSAKRAATRDSLCSL